MRVLYLLQSPQIGGGNRSMLTLWRTLMPRGLAPVAVCPGDGDMAAACRQLDVPCVVMEIPQPSLREPLRTWKGYRRWRRLLHEWDIDLIHTQGEIGARSIALAARRSGVPLLLHCQFPPPEQFMRWAFRRLPKPDQIVFCSHGLQNDVGPLFHQACPQAAQTVIHNCTVLQDFNPPTNERPGRPRIGIVANLIPVKGHLDFIAMAHRLTVDGIDAEYQIIGGDVHESGYRTTLESRVRELKLDNHVTFLGHCKNVPELLRSLDVAVCCSHVEPFGICLTEAMAAGLPLVATRVGGIPEVVEEGVTGLLVSPAAPAELTAAVKRLLHDAELRRKMGLAGKQRVQDHFTHEVNGRKFEAVYRELRAATGADARLRSCDPLGPGKA